MLARFHRKKISSLLFLLFYQSMVIPALAESYHRESSRLYSNSIGVPSLRNNKESYPPVMRLPVSNGDRNKTEIKEDFIGGPSQPEMSSFKSVNSDNLVNLFTGDFNYNIPLMDVGGYPVNIYYDAGVSPEQEASWVGLGWNLNPGNVNRNARGVPDDFNGTDTLIQIQKMKPNKTWGLNFGTNFEGLGIKLPVEAAVGVSFNNYLGPSLDFNVRGNLAAKMSKLAGSEKLSGDAKFTVGLNVNSRAGTSISTSASFAANYHRNDNKYSFGIGLSTGYNSRNGLKALNISEQHSYNYKETKKQTDKASENSRMPVDKSINDFTKFSTSISFSKPSYSPSLRMPVTNKAWSGRFQLGSGSFGIAVDMEAEVYGQTSRIDASDVEQRKRMVGYMYYQNAQNNPDMVMDFSRFNDREVTPNTPIISAPQYSYDVFSIQGEGTGGSIRAFRNDLGYVRDNYTVTKDENFSVGADIDPPGHFGGNFNTIRTPSTIGEWNSGNMLRNRLQFVKSDKTFENVYFRNPGENTVTDTDRLAQVGGVDLVRFVLGGSNQSPTIEPKLQRFSKDLKLGTPIVDLAAQPVFPTRNKRTQVISFLTAAEAAVAGLDTEIKNYDAAIFWPGTDSLKFERIARVSDYRKPHHISQINVTESNGRRYVYGVPVYNILQKDFTFSVNPSYSQIPEKVLVNAGDHQPSSSLLDDNSSVDGFLQISHTPASAHSFLLSGILSPDYVDVTGNGITEDDLGDAVKFNYSKMKSGGNDKHRWRSPFSNADSANFNAGNRSEKKDDKGMIAYGERESWYLHSIESKTMIALFYVSDRLDGRGVMSESGSINNTENLVKKLDSIALFSKADLKKNRLNNAKPIKTVHFRYSYLLCQNTPDNASSTTGMKGKLTLDSLYTTYQGKNRGVKNKYSFYYAAIDSVGNPSYIPNASDRWGSFKPASLNPAGLNNADYPYTIQPSGSTGTLDAYASAWALRKIVLPSGGQMEIKYESDDYAWVQDKRAAAMMQVVGYGSTSSYAASSNRLYPFQYPVAVENDYVFVQVPSPCTNAADVYNKYLQGVKQLAFKIWVQMPKDYEYIPCYANFSPGDYGVDGSNPNIIWIKMQRVAGRSPLSIATLEYLREQLPGQAFRGYDVSESDGLKKIGDMLLGMLTSLRDAFKDPVNALRTDGKAMNTVLSKCFVRLNDPDGIKYGGGYRVKSVTISDNWNLMTRQYNSTYGQLYDYKTTENFNGIIRTISSGVASYEPSIGGEENPFQTMMEVRDVLPLGPTSYGAVEMPVLDAFFPAPVVGYSKVTVTSIKRDSVNKKSRSGVGRQVTEFYTAKDFPVQHSFTPFDAGSVKEFHQNSTLAFFNKYAYDFKAHSQGFLVATNDMHGKMKSQSSYAENDSSTRISYTENFYKNTGANGLGDLFTFIDKENGGTAFMGNMGVDVDLMTDTREFSVKANSFELQGQVDIFYFLVPVPVPTIWPVSGDADNIYRSVTTTKVVNYHAVLDSTVVIDKGSQVSTKNLAFDAHTGEVLVSRTNNEFNKAVYNTSYPAYWAYEGMGLAYKNIDAVYSGVNFSDGRITNGGFDMSVFESGDELLIKSAAIPGSGCDAQLASGAKTMIWALDKKRNLGPLASTPDFIFIDAKGVPYTMSNVSFRIIRSGKRNMLDGKVATIISMVNPLASGKLLFDTASKVINATAVEFKERWMVDNDVLRRLKLVKDPVTCIISEVEDSTGYLEKSINPYRKGLLGIYRPHRSKVFYDSRREYDTAAYTNISEFGFLKNFKLYWAFNVSNKLMPDSNSTQWVWNTKVNKLNARGLELETQDALGIYTSAQYGYRKTLPVAIAANARYHEMFAENFEDYGYDESLNNAQYNFSKRHVDFRKMTNSALVDTDTTQFKAHSGRYVRAVNAGATASYDIPVAALLTNNDPALVFGKDTTKLLNNLGGRYGFNSIIPTVVGPSDKGTPSFGTSAYTMQIYPKDSIYSNGNRGHYYSFYDTFYLQVTTGATYNFSMSISTAYNNSGVTVFAHSHGFGAMIYDELGNIVSNQTLSQNGFQFTSSSYSVFLCPGIYKIIHSGTELYQATNNGLNYTNNNYSWSSSNLSSPDYRDLSTVNGCEFTKPIYGVDSMLNPTFMVSPGKKMLFSGWVKETCGDAAAGIPCKEHSYTHNQVQLSFAGFPGSNKTITPSGPIIDGWQRYEGVFYAPAGAASMTLSLVNSGSGKMYVDDLRIHPFNSNIKSYVYDPINLRLLGELDANNYGTFYEYDEEGVLTRTKIETREGIKTVTETRSSLQKVIR